MSYVPLFLSALAFLVSVIAALFAWRAARFAALNCAASVSVQKLAWIESELLDTRDLISGLEHALRKIRSRMYVRKRADEKDQDDVVPTDREALKRHLRAKVGLATVNRKG